MIIVLANFNVTAGDCSLIVFNCQPFRICTRVFPFLFYLHCKANKINKIRSVSLVLHVCTNDIFYSLVN